VGAELPVSPKNRSPRPEIAGRIQVRANFSLLKQPNARIKLPPRPSHNDPVQVDTNTTRHLICQLRNYEVGGNLPVSYRLQNRQDNFSPSVS
jgi:hypothetical protein